MIVVYVCTMDSDTPACIYVCKYGHVPDRESELSKVGVAVSEEVATVFTSGHQDTLGNMSGDLIVVPAEEREGDK